MFQQVLEDQHRYHKSCWSPVLLANSMLKALILPDNEKLHERRLTSDDLCLNGAGVLHCYQPPTVKNRVGLPNICLMTENWARKRTLESKGPPPPPRRIDNHSSAFATSCCQTASGGPGKTTMGQKTQSVPHGRCCSTKLSYAQGHASKHDGSINMCS